MPKLKHKKDWSSIISKMKEQNSGKANFKDERLYQPEYKEDGTATAVVRFLEAPDVDLPIVHNYSHYFRGVGGWYVDLCPTTIGGQCPVCEDNSKLWDAGKEEEVRKRRSSRTLSYYANILVVEDKKNPSNEGKVFIYKFGKKIYEKIEAVLNEGFIPWDENAGVNFRIRSKKVKVGANMLPNYDQSNFFENETALSEFGDVDKINESLYKLGEFVDRSKFKQYTELVAKLNTALGISGKPKPKSKPVDESSGDDNQAESDDVDTDIGSDKASDSKDIEDTEVFDVSEDDDFFDDMDE